MGDPARLDMKLHVIELEKDPAMPSAIDSWPGGGDELSRDPAARSETELESLVNLVSAPVVQDCASPGRIASPGARRGVAADGALEENGPTDQPLLNHISKRGEIPIPAPVVEDREHFARAVTRGDHPVRLGGRKGHDLIHHAVLARLESTDDKLFMRVVGRGDDDQIHVGVNKDGVDARIAHASPGRRRFRPKRWVASHHPAQVEVALARDQGAMKDASRQTISDYHRLKHANILP